MKTPTSILKNLLSKSIHSFLYVLMIAGILVMCELSFAQTMVKDINSINYGSTPTFITAIGNFIYFSATDQIAVTRLFKSDGTETGTYSVNNISSPYLKLSPVDFYNNLQTFCNNNGTIFFNAYDSIHGYELWKSDGTDAGTMLVKDIFPGTSNSDLSKFFAVNGTLFFWANNGINGIELWKSDGTEAGTVMVKDIRVGSSSSSPTQLTNVNGTLFFWANNGINGIELWKSDGTEAGTVMVKDICAGSCSSFEQNYTPYFANVNGILYFSANDGINGKELWKSDGTETGTIMVMDINPGSASALPSNFANVNNTLFFKANDGLNGYELWKSDGTESGTVMVKDITPGINSYTPMYLVNVNGILFFQAENDSSSSDLWKSDGTEAGTVMVKQLNSNLSLFTDVNGILFFKVDSSIWKSDGTEAGTVLVKDGLTSINILKNVNGTLFFRTNDCSAGYKLWKSDGTNAGTVMLAAFGPCSPVTNNITHFTVDANGNIYFQANDGINGEELWKSDGTEAGTVMVKNIYYATSPESDPYRLTDVNGTLFFQANDGINGKELWKSDGSETGTVLVKNICAGSSNSNLDWLTNVNGTLFFHAVNGIHGSELWKSDGTDAGTVMVTDINPDSSGSYPSRLTNVNGTLFFTAYDGINGYELWKSDGTEAGTIMVKDIVPGTGSSYPEQFIAVNETLFFMANNGINGLELWKSDGTEAGTVMVKYISFSKMTAGNNVLFFKAIDGIHGSELWQSDGTDAGTVMVKDINPGSSSSYTNGTLYPFSCAFNGAMFFPATDGTNGVELWKSDGTEAGTAMVKDIYSGSSSSYPTNLTFVNDVLFFTADNGTNGRELWRSDGTEAGTVMLDDIRVGSNSSSPYYLINVNGTLFFNADDGKKGKELWKYFHCYGTPSTFTVSACDSYTWLNGVTYTSSTNTPTYILYDASGCDSVVTLNLTIHNSDTIIDSHTACDSYTWIDGITYTTSNTTATYILTNVNGCDSVYALNLTINNSFTDTVNVAICEGETFALPDGTIVTTSGTYTSQFMSIFGCDSTIVTELVVNTLPIIYFSGLSAEYCKTDTNVLLIGNNSTDGIFTGTGLISGTNIFNPVNASLGSSLISYTYTDNNGCTNTYSQAVTVNEVPEITVSTTNASCGEANGTASIQATGGTAPYTYSTGSSTLTNIPAGSYSVLVTDVKGCKADQTYLIINDGGPLVTITQQNNPTCNASCDGSIIIDVTGGNPPYLYNWSNGSTQQNPTNLCSGEISVEVQDGNNCITGIVADLGFTQPYPTIYGRITYSGGGIDGQYATLKIYSITQQQGGGYQEVDAETQIASDGTFFISQFFPDNYVLKVILNGENPAYESLVSSYYSTIGNAYTWEMADTINMSCGISFEANITMYELSPFIPGNGVISGSIVYAETSSKNQKGIYINHSKSTGTPVTFTDIFIQSVPINLPFSNTFTNENGEYEFAEIPEGIYSLKVEIPGFPMLSTYEVTINGLDTSFSDLNFFVDTLYGGDIYTSSINNSGVESPVISFSVFSNPYREYTNIIYKLSNSSHVTLEVYDVIGNKVIVLADEHQIVGEYNYLLNAKKLQLTSGSYFVQLISGTNIYLKKIIQIE